MKKLLISTALFVVGISIGIASVRLNASASEPVSAITPVFVQSGWPYCNEPVPLVPFFDPCPPGSHIDATCAAACGIKYQAKMMTMYRRACTDFGNLYYAVEKEIKREEEKRDACIAAGTSPVTCEKAYKAALLKLDSQHGIDKEKLNKRVAEEAQKNLDDYYTCLFACNCLEN